MEAKTASESKSRSRSRSAEPVKRGTNEKGVGNDKDKSSESDNVQIPTDTSPYVQYADLEDYKIKGYGATGHLPVVDRAHHGGGTDGPTLSGSGLPQQKQPQSQ